MPGVPGSARAASSMPRPTSVAALSANGCRTTCPRGRAAVHGARASVGERLPAAAGMLGETSSARTTGQTPSRDTRTLGPASARRSRAAVRQARAAREGLRSRWRPGARKAYPMSAQTGRRPASTHGLARRTKSMAVIIERGRWGCDYGMRNGDSCAAIRSTAGQDPRNSGAGGRGVGYAGGRRPGVNRATGN